MCKSLISFVRGITVEPAFLLFLITYFNLEFLYTNLFIQKTCRYNQTSEPDLSTECHNQTQGILFVSEVDTDYRWIASLLTFVYLMLAICWSDEAGRRRRPLIIIPILGQILLAVSGCLHSYFWPWIPVSSVISKYMLEILTGGSLLMPVTSQMYVCDVSDKENRTMRLGLLWLVRTISVSIGRGSSGFILRGLGFFYSFLVCGVLSVLSLVMSLIFIADISVPVKHKVRFCDILNLKIVLNGFKVVFKKSLRHKRTIVVLLLMVNCLGWFLENGEHTVDYLFLKYQFHWDERMFSTYQFYRSVGVGLGTIFCSIVLSKLLRVHDGVIGALASFFDTLAACGYVAATENWHFYLSSLFDVFHGSSISVSVSFASKFYNSTEYGRLHSVIGVFGLLTPLGFLLYNKVFLYTLQTFPAAFFCISIATSFSVFLMYYICYTLDKKMTKELPPEKEVKPMLSGIPSVKIIISQDETSDIT